MDILTFWEMTPYEFYIVANAYYERSKQDAEEKITLAYMTALWTAQWFSKKKRDRPKPLKEILVEGKPKTKKQMTAEEMLEEVKKIHKQLGGD